ncbi:unnamed protein product [Amaranthus hypochondriacus]
MEVEFQGTILHQFRAEIPAIIKPSNTHLGILKVPSAFGENISNSYPRWKSLELHCSNDQSTQLSYVSTSDSQSQRLPELSFNRLQPTEEEVDGLQRRHFGRFLAREAVLDEEYWVCLLFLFSLPSRSTMYLCMLTFTVSCILLFYL